MAPATSAPPSAAPSITPGTPATPSAMTTAAANPAPPETPSTPGSASGLRNKPCMTAPDRPSAAPTSAAQTARGARMRKRISPAGEAGWAKALAYCAALRLVSPNAIETRRASASRLSNRRMSRMR